MLRIVFHSGMPAQFPLDRSATFLPGQVAQLTVVGNNICATVSNGSAPIGIIDDVRTKAFTNISWNEEIVVPATGVESNGVLVTPVDIKAELKEANLLPNSFTSDIKVLLNPKNGVITFIAGTPLNYDAIGSGVPNAIRAIVNYTYFVPNVMGDDSTAGSNRITVWYERMMIETDQFETNQSYALNSNLYISEVGLFTTRRPTENHPSVGFVTAPPSPFSSTLQLMWL